MRNNNRRLCTGFSFFFAFVKTSSITWGQMDQRPAGHFLFFRNYVEHVAKRWSRKALGSQQSVRANVFLCSSGPAFSSKYARYGAIWGSPARRGKQPLSMLWWDLGCTVLFSKNIRRAWACVGVRGRAWACVGVRGRAWASVGALRRAWACVGMRGRVWACVGVRGRAWACAGVRGRA